MGKFVLSLRGLRVERKPSAITPKQSQSRSPRPVGLAMTIGVIPSLSRNLSRMRATSLKLPIVLTLILTHISAVLRKAFKPAYVTTLVVFGLFMLVYMATSGVQLTHATGLTKYPVIAGGNWSADATWTLNADGTTNATTKPDATDDVIMNSTSGAVTIDATSVAQSLNCTGYTNTLTHNAFTLTVSGNVTLASGKYTAVGAATLAMNATGTLISAGNTLYNLTTSVGTITLGDASNVSNTFTHTSGTLITDGGAGSLTHNWLYFNSANSNIRTITLGNSTINISGTVTNSFNIYIPTNITLNANTSVINMTGASSNPIFTTSGLTYNTVNFTGSGVPAISIFGGIIPTFATLTRTGTAVKTDGLTIYGGNIIVTGTLNLSGQSATNRLLVQSSTIGTPRVITVSGATVTTDNVDIQDITFARSDAGALDLSAGQTRSVGDCGGNTKTLGDSTTLTFTTADTQTWNAANGGNWSGANWTGTAISRVPLPQDDVNMARVGGYNSGVTVIADMPRLGRSIDWTGATWTGTATTFQDQYYRPTIYGSLTLISNMSYYTHSDANPLTFAGRGNFTITTAGKKFSGVLINAPGGTYTLMDAYVKSTGNQYAQLSLNYGNLTTNYDVTVSSYYSSAGTTTTMSTGATNLWTVGGTNWTEGWNAVGTLVVGGANLLLNPSSDSRFQGGTNTFNNIQIAPGSGVLTMSGAFTFANMTMTAPGTKTIKFAINTTYTMTGTNFLSGTAGNLVTIDSDDGATRFTLAKASGSVTSNWLSIKNCAITAGATWTAFASTNAGNNSTSPGWVFPKTAVAAGGNWSATTTWSDGVVPTASTDVYLIAGSGAVTIDAASVAKSLDCTGYTNTLTHNAFTLTVSGSVTLAAAHYTTSGAATLAMNATGTLISAGNTLYSLTTSVGTITLGDGLTASATLNLISGTFDTANYAVNIGGFNATGVGVRVLALGTSTLTANGTNVSYPWYYAGSNLTVTGTTSNIIISKASPIVNCGGLSFPGTFQFTGGGTATLKGGNTFVNLGYQGTAVKTDILSIYDGNQTVTGTLSLAGNSATNRLLVQSNTIGTPRVITVSGATVTTDNVDIQDITFARSDAGALDLSAGQTRSVGDCGGNTKTLGDSTTLTFTTADAQTWSAANGGNWSGANWTGTTLSRVPLPQDNVSFATAFNSGVTVTSDMPRLGKSIDWTGATWTGTATRWTLAAPAVQTIYGSLNLSAASGAITLATGSTSFTFGGRGAFLLTSAGHGFRSTVINMYGGSLSLQDALLWGFSISVINGGLISNGNSLSGLEFGSTTANSGRVIDITNSLVSVSGGGTNAWGVVDSGLTLTTTGSTISFTGTATSSSFVGGTQTYNNIQFAPSTGYTLISGAFTFANMTMSSAGTKTVKFAKNTTYTMTGTSFLNGTAGNLVTIDTNDGTGQFTLNKASGTVIADYDNISRSNITGSAKWYMTTNSVNGTNNTGWLTDATPPTNPTVSSVNVGGTGVTSGTWINYNGATNFNWSGSADPDSGLAGYYTYFGTDSAGDPATYQAHSGADGDTQTYSSSIAGSDDGKHFYFRVKTKDVVGNVGTAVTLFDFGYDTTLPTRPTFVAADPAGYTTTNSFTFTWPAGGDANGAGGSASGIKWYEYKRATDGAWSHTADSATRTIAGITAYQEGANAFYVRTVDNAGNISTNYQQVTYYWSGVAPAKPTSLAVSPDTSDTNLFTISWDKPAVGAGDPPVKGYYYSINEVPTMTNLTYKASTADTTTIGPDAFATAQGTNTIYVLSVNEAGNYSLEDSYVASKTFTCQTSALPAPIQASIVDSSDRTLDRWMLTLQWAPGANQGSSFDHYVIYRSTNGLGFTQLATTTSTAYVDASGLTNSTTYYYNIKAVDNAGKESAQSTTVSKMPTGKYLTPPTYLNSPDVSNVKSSSADIAWLTDRSSTSIVKYGKSRTDLGASSGQMDLATTHEVSLMGLDSSATYYFQVQSLDENRDYEPSAAYSTTYSFQTLQAPAISNVQVDNITLTSADASWETTTVSNSALQYGQNSSFDKTLQDISGSQATRHSVKLSDLTNSTKYAFKITAIDIDGNEIKSDNYNFGTLPMPAVANLKATILSDKARTGIKITWTTNVDTSSIIKYSIDNKNEKESVTSKLTKEHEMIIENLSDQSNYKITALGRDSLGNLTDATSTTIKTPDDTRPPAISNITIETSNVGLNKQDLAQAVISWSTDEPATSKVEYGLGLSGESYEKMTGEDAGLNLQHVTIISDLDPTTPYHLRVNSKDAASNLATSDSQVVISAEVQKSTLRILLDALQKAFSWINI